MNPPYFFGPSVPATEWMNLRRRAVLEYSKWDIQSGDQCVLCDFSLLLPTAEWERLARMAEGLAAEVLAAESELLERPDLHSLLGLPPKIRRALARSDRDPARAARLMRFDFHFTDQGWKISEANTDVPGGFLEASAFAELMAPFCGGRALSDPAAAYSEAIMEGLPERPVIALAHATAFTDDRQEMLCLGKRLVSKGARAFLVSPDHLRWKDGIAFLPTTWGGLKVDSVVRVFPAEWLPRLDGSEWEFFFRRWRTPVNNPGSALLTQSKRFPLAWGSMRSSLPHWRSLLPETLDPRDAGDDAQEWVLKPIFGRVGDGVAIAGVTSPQRFADLARVAARNSGEWIRQKRFRALPTLRNGKEYFPSVGVYTVNARAAGIYGRIAQRPLIDDHAQDIAVLIQEVAA